jgi:hypothetical protein
VKKFVQDLCETAMAKRFVLALLSLVISCPFCSAQTTVVDVKDESVVNCPVRLSGTIKVTESEVDGVNHTSFVSHVSATNLSNQPIIAMVTDISIGNSLGPLVAQNHLLDAFFSHDLEIAPGQTYTLKHDDDSGTFSMSVAGITKTSPAASAQVIFVQFADSTTCGDIKDGRVETLMDARADLFQALKKIDTAAKADESKFLNALAEKPMDRTAKAEAILDKIRIMQKEKGSAVVIEHIRSMLDVAASR